MKNITKPTFGKIFLKKIIISAAIAAAVITAALTALSLIYRSSRDDYLSSEYLQQVNILRERFSEYEKGISEENFRDMLLNINFKMAVACSPAVGDAGNIYCRIIDKNTEKVLADSEERIYFVLSADVGKNIVYTALKSEEISADYRKLSDEAEKLGSDYSVECISIYIKDSVVFPRIALLKHDFRNQRSLIFKSVDYAPDNTENSIYLEKTEIIYDQTDQQYCTNGTGSENYLWCIAGTDKNSRSAKALNSFLEKNSLTNVKYTNRNLDGCYIDSYYEYLSFPDGTEHNVCIYFSGTDSFISDYLLWVIIACTVILAAALLIALFAAGTQYSRENAQYEIFSARRETTNAMAHDLKTPLASISGYAEILGENINPEKREYYIEKISENICRMNATVGDILELAKSESFSSELKTERFSVKDIVEELISAISITLEKRGLNYKVCGDTMLNTDKNTFSQAVLNLLQNAAIYSAENSEITTEITDESLKISNIPAKIPKKSAEELIKPFVRENDARGEEQGSGIGLAIAKADLEQLGFSLKIEIKNKFTAECIFRQNK